MLNPFNHLAKAWQRNFSVYSALDPLSAEIRGKHLSSILRVAPFTLGANIFNGMLICFAFAHTTWLVPVLCWLFSLTVIAGIGMRAWWIGRKKPIKTASPHAIRRATWHAIYLASIWGLMPALLFPQASPTQQVLIASIVPGMMCGGAFILSSIPQAGLAYLWMMTLPSLYAVLSIHNIWFNVIACLLVIYAGTVSMGVWTAAKAANARLKSEREAERQSQMVTLLLRDFEDQTADVLWEINMVGQFTHVTHKLAALLNQRPATLAQTTMQAWFKEHCGDVTPLKQAMRAGQPFRKLLLPVRLDGKDQFWSITARPLFDEAGHCFGWRGVISDVTQEQQAQLRLRDMAQFDALTGTHNRGYLREQLATALDQASAKGTRGALLCLDVDNFKGINDALGHTVGDQVLQAVAHRIQEICQGMTVARLGGDEFAVLVQPIQQDRDAMAVAMHLLDGMKQPFIIADHSVNVGLSIGVGLIPDHGENLDELLANADLAMMAAKTNGRGRAEFFARSLGERNRRKLTLENELRRALLNNQFTLFWQPKVQTEAWYVCGAEALIRWHHPTLGTIPPSEFIPVAESAGLITDIGNWVLREACKVAARELPGLTISINASPAQLLRTDFITQVDAALAAANLPPEHLEVEITESLFMDASPIALRNLRALHKRGVRVALDDFGTGYSSLAYLRKFPFDTLKIDRAFVCELLSRPDARAIVRTIIDLARTLGMDTVAEGVEEPAQLVVLERAGCTVIQGYLIAKPVTIEEFHTLLEGWIPGNAPQVSAVPQTEFGQMQALRSFPSSMDATTLFG
ncbi:MAG TPA: EAL domain-containing protein [Aquabacterium sp.]|nr:EAL domain-containing protein [Aquabacterium sp.]